MRPPLIMVAPNGARRSKADHPALPLSTAEIVATARACNTAGAQALHLHIRDGNGRHSLDAGRYRETLAELKRAVPDMAVQITTEAGGIFSVSDQLTCLQQVRPDRASISVREIARDADLAPRIYASCAGNGTQVQHILYDMDDVALLKDWYNQGIVPADQTDVLCVLGRYADGQPANPADIRLFSTALGQTDNWMVCSFGPAEHACLIEAARQGADLRVGFENSLTAEDGSAWVDNAASVAALRARLVALAEKEEVA